MNKYWLFDSAVRRSTEGAKIIPGKISKDERNPLFTEGIREIPALPWEVLIGNGYPNVFYDPYIKKYRCYYTCYLSADHDNSGIKNTQEYKAKESRITGILYAESEDGIHWLKPALGAIEYAGSSANNIVALNTHGAGVFLDAEEKDPEKRYKIITRDDLGPLNIQAAFSADGIHFKNWQPVIDDPRYPGDTHNFVIRDPRSGAYLLYTRTFVREIRTEARLVSDDFIHWTEGTVVLRGADADDQVYAMPVFIRMACTGDLPRSFIPGMRRFHILIMWKSNCVIPLTEFNGSGSLPVYLLFRMGLMEHMISEFVIQPPRFLTG